MEMHLRQGPILIRYPRRGSCGAPDEYSSLILPKAFCAATPNPIRKSCVAKVPLFGPSSGIERSCRDQCHCAMWLDSARHQRRLGLACSPEKSHDTAPLLRHQRSSAPRDARLSLGYLREACLSAPANCIGHRNVLFQGFMSQQGRKIINRVPNCPNSPILG